MNCMEIIYNFLFYHKNILVGVHDVSKLIDSSKLYKSMLILYSSLPNIFKKLDHDAKKQNLVTFKVMYA